MSEELKASILKRYNKAKEARDPISDTEFCRIVQISMNTLRYILGKSTWH